MRRASVPALPPLPPPSVAVAVLLPPVVTIRLLRSLNRPAIRGLYSPGQWQVTAVQHSSLGVAQSIASCSSSSSSSSSRRRGGASTTTIVQRRVPDPGSRWRRECPMQTLVEARAARAGSSLSSPLLFPGSRTSCQLEAKRAAWCRKGFKEE